jgi:hypothetical protein
MTTPTDSDKGGMGAPAASELDLSLLTSKSLNQWRLKKIEYGFDERKLNHLTPLGKSAGMVKVTFTDNTAMGNTCTRDTLASILIYKVKENDENPTPYTAIRL